MPFCTDAIYLTWEIESRGKSYSKRFFVVLTLIVWVCVMFLFLTVFQTGPPYVRLSQLPRLFRLSCLFRLSYAWQASIYMSETPSIRVDPERVENGAKMSQNAFAFTRCRIEIVWKRHPISKTIPKLCEMKTEPLAVSCEHKIRYFFVPLYSAQLSLSQHSWTAVDVALNVLIAMRQCLGKGFTSLRYLFLSICLHSFTSVCLSM